MRQVGAGDGGENEEAVAARLPTEGTSADDAPQWPDEAAEAAFLSEQRANGTGVAAAPPSTAASAEESDKEEAPLPPLQTLVDRIPGEAKDVLEELFRAKFFAVRRVPKSALKV